MDIGETNTTMKKRYNDFGRKNTYGKEILVMETGYSTGGLIINKNDKYDEQKSYYTDLTNKLKTYYYDERGKEKGFLGVLWYELTEDMDIDFRNIEENFGLIEDRNRGGGVSCRWGYKRCLVLVAG